MTLHTSRSGKPDSTASPPEYWQGVRDILSDSIRRRRKLRPGESLLVDHATYDEFRALIGPRAWLTLKEVGFQRDSRGWIYNCGGPLRRLPVPTRLLNYVESQGKMKPAYRREYLR